MPNPGSDSIMIDPSKEKWVERFVRFGLISKGVVYCLIGVIAFLAAGDLTREKASKREAFRFIYDQPYGQVLVAIIALGIFGFVVLRFFQSVKDIDNKGENTKGVFSRIGYAISGLVYLGLALYAAKLVLEGRTGDDGSHTFIVSRLLSRGWGPWAIGIAGLGIIANGIYQIYKALSGAFMKRVMVIRGELENLVKKAGVVGYFSRGIVLVIIGYLVLHAALTSNPNDAKGTEGAFAFIENTFGGVLMGVIALGLFGYGLFMFVKARFQRIEIDLD
jgi:hypothetical protein